MKAFNEQMPIMTYIPKESNPNKPPKYFLVFQEKVEKFMSEQREFNKQVLEFMIEQRKINALILQRLDKVEQRLDNLIEKNDLKE